jgi:hypothetical protein
MGLFIYWFVRCCKYDLNMLMPSIYKAFYREVAFSCKFKQDGRIFMSMVYR